MLKNKDKDIESKKFLLVSHYATYAMQDLLYEYLTNNKVKLVKKINFPLPELPFLKGIEIEENVKGRLLRKTYLASLVKPSFIAYVLHFLQLIWLGISDKNSYDVAIAENSLLVFGCLCLKKVGRIKKIIFYSHGIADDRFHESLMNSVYQWMDSYSARHSDLSWLLSKKMIPTRIKQGVPEDAIFWVPTALQLSKMERKSAYQKEALVFIGAINEMNGAFMLSKIMKSIWRKHPTIGLDIIGDGPLMESLKVDFKKINTNGKVSFLGVQRFDDYKDTLTDYIAGLAPYKPSASNLLQSTDPMKVRLYMAAGLPTITTKGFPFSKEIVENDLGFTVEYEERSYADAIERLLSDKGMYQLKRKNNLEYSKRFDQQRVFKAPLEILIK